jgi:hypothetical protein
VHEKCFDGLCFINAQYVTDEDTMLIQTGFNIFIIFMYIDRMQHHKKPMFSMLKLFEFNEEIED